MGLPRRRQQLAREMHYRDLSYQDVADALGITTNRVANLCKGGTYPSPEECWALQRLFGTLPYQALFDEEMLEYFDNWPPPRGMAMYFDRHPKKSSE